MSDPSIWTVLSSSSIGGSAVVAVEAGKYVLGHAGNRKSLFWIGAGINVSVPGLPASGAVSTSAHWSTPGRVYFSKLAPHRVNPNLSPEQVFGGNGLIFEIGINSALTRVLGLEPLIRDWARARGIHDWENQACGQMLLFNTTTNLFGSILGVGLSDIISILLELATTGDYTSIYTQAIAFVASTSTGADTGGVTVTQGSWLLW
jgi:hypothetical protein